MVRTLLYQKGGAKICLIFLNLRKRKEGWDEHDPIFGENSAYIHECRFGLGEERHVIGIFLCCGFSSCKEL